MGACPAAIRKLASTKRQISIYLRENSAMNTMRIWVCLVGLFASTVALGQTADTIYHNGSILTMAGKDPTYVEALAVKDGKIALAGSKEAALKMKGDATKVVDLGGTALLPGFLDPHSHYINSLLVANQCQLYAPPSGPGKDAPSIIAELKKFAAARKIQKGDFIMGYGYDDTVMPDDRLLNRDDLDEAFPDNPVRIDHVSMHGAVMNSLALKKYGISAETKTPSGGVIVRKPGTEEPWGLIMETAFLPIMEQAEPMTAQQEIDWSRAGQMLYAEAGITTAHEGASHLPQIQTIKRASEAGANIIDVIAYPFITDVDKVLAEIPLTDWGTYHKRFKIGGVKITMDGSPQGRTAAFTTPYLTGGPSGEKDWKGELTFPQDLANKMVKRVYGMNVPLNLHCNGDAAIDGFLAAYEFARAGDYSRPWNVTTIHTQFMRKDHIPKFVEYKVRPSFYSLHTFYFADAHIKNRGKEQAMYISPMRDAIDAGLHPATKEGIFFTDHYGQQSCTAGRAAFISGSVPVRTGMTKVGIPGAPEGWQKTDVTMATVMKSLGYATGQFGKNHQGDRNEHLPTMHGFDEFLGNLYHLNAEEEPENEDYPGDLVLPSGKTFREAFGPRGVLRCVADGKGGQSIEDTGPLTKKRMETIDEETVAAAKEFITRQTKAGKPFFCWWNGTAHALSHAREERASPQGQRRIHRWHDRARLAGRRTPETSR